MRRERLSCCDMLSSTVVEIAVSAERVHVSSCDEAVDDAFALQYLLRTDYSIGTVLKWQLAYKCSIPLRTVLRLWIGAEGASLRLQTRSSLLIHCSGDTQAAYC